MLCTPNREETALKLIVCCTSAAAIRYSSVLQYDATSYAASSVWHMLHCCSCNSLQCTAIQVTVVHCYIVCYMIVLHCTFIHWTLYDVVWYTVVAAVVMCFTTLLYTVVVQGMLHRSLYVSLLQCTASHCNTLLHHELHCTEPQLIVCCTTVDSAHCALHSCTHQEITCYYTSFQ